MRFLTFHPFFRSDENCVDLMTPLCYIAELVDPCPNGWIYLGSSETCVQIGTQPTTSWSGCKSQCENQGARLVKEQLSNLWPLSYGHGGPRKEMPNLVSATPNFLLCISLLKA